MKTCERCNRKFGIFWTNPVTGKKHNLSSRKYCLLCSPFGLHNTCNLNETKNVISRKCPRCNKVKSLDEFYKRRGKDGSSTYCKQCTSNQCLERQRRLKLLAVAYLGSCCKLCGYNKCIAALDFHHTDPSEKDFSISDNFKHRSFEVIRPELDKCILVCSNCHRELHWGPKNQ